MNPQQSKLVRDAMFGVALVFIAFCVMARFTQSIFGAIVVMIALIGSLSIIGVAFFTQFNKAAKTDSK